MSITHDAYPIWDHTREPDSWRIFRKSFEWDRTPGTVLEISAESTFDIQLNGRRVPIQQLSDFPESRTFSRVKADGFLKKGKNRITVAVHWNGESFGTSKPGTPYLIAAVRAGKRLFCTTDSSWKCADAVMFRSGLRCKVTCQLGFAYCYDANREKDLKWKTARQLDGSGIRQEMHLRPVPPLNELEPPPVELVQCGILRRTAGTGTFARRCMTDFLAPKTDSALFAGLEKTSFAETVTKSRLKLSLDTPLLQFRPLKDFPDANGYYVILDTGRECSGYFRLKIKTGKGTVLDIAHGEHLKDGRVRAVIDQRNFADRYICKEGLNEFVFPHRRLGGRYLELHITKVSGSTALGYAGIIPAELPLPPACFPETEDRLLQKAQALALRTLHLCMHEHYEDTPWREQSLYAYDSRNQMLFGYYGWGNWAFAENSLDLLGRSFDGERYLALTAPSAVQLTIPVFTMVWITALHEYILYSGNAGIFLKWQSVIERILDRALSEQLPEGLHSPGDGKKIWNFYEWNGILSRMEDPEQPLYNLYLAEALRAAAAMHAAAGAEKRADFLRKQAERIAALVKNRFFDRRKGFFRASAGDREGYDHMQILALLQCRLSEAERAKILSNLMHRQFRPAELSVMVYWIRALMQGSEASRAFLMRDLNETMDLFLNAGASSIWETRNGEEDFERAGSLSHAWGAFVPCWTGGCLLGVEPLTPGFRTFRVKPWCGSYTHFSGEVPTPHGRIRVSWKKTGAGIEVDVETPPGTEPVPESCPEFPIVRFRSARSSGNGKAGH